MKKIISKFLVLITLILLCTNCEKEGIINPVNEAQNFNNQFKIRKVKLSEIPSVKNFLTAKNILGNAKSTEIDGAIFDNDNIMEVIDTLNRTNYSFKFSYPDTSVGTFYNLIVGKTPEGENKTPYVLKYVCNDANLSDFISNNFEFSHFKGQVSVHKYTDFFQPDTFTKGETNCPPTYDEYGDPIACEDMLIDGGGSTTSGGGDGGEPNGGPTSGTGSTGGSGGGGSYCTFSVSYEPCGCGGNADGHAPVGNACCAGSPTTIAIDCPALKSFSQKAGEDCPGCPETTGGIGVLPSPSSTRDMAEILNELLSEESPFDIDISNVLDSINLPTPDSTNLANSKFLCIYDKLTKSDGFKKLFIDTFGDSDKFNVTFEIVDDLPSNVGGRTGATVFLVNGNFNRINVIIKMNKAKLISNPSFSISRTIIHEAIHAYLKLKLRDCNAGSSLDFLNNLDLEETIREYYDNFNCAVPGQSQHEFMFDHMIPVMTQILSEVKDNLVPLHHQTSAEGENFSSPSNPVVPDTPFNWNDFYSYLSLQGLDSTEGFASQIRNDSVQNYLYSRYINEGALFSKSHCQN